jgi:hypothetical protein
VALRVHWAATGECFLRGPAVFGGKTRLMIRLTVIGEQSRAMEITSALYFRITGGAVWIGPGVHAPLVRYVGGRWEHGDVLWSGMRFEGKCRLVFGLPRDPAGVSDAIDSLSIHGNTLCANGIPFAAYDHQHEMWRGVEANSWWHAFRVESAAYRPASGRSHESEHVLPQLPREDRRNETAPQYRRRLPMGTRLPPPIENGWRTARARSLRSVRE